MKTRYLAEANLAMLKADYGNEYLKDALTSYLYVGLLSSLPDESGDGWQGAGEIFNDITQNEEIGQPTGINWGNYTSGYAPQILSRSSFTTPTFYNNTEIAASGMSMYYNDIIEFSTATGSWGNIIGLVFYGSRVGSAGLRITPLFTVAFDSPVTISADTRFSCNYSGDLSSTGIRITELTKQN